MRTLLVTAMCLMLLAGCGESKPPEKTVFDTQVQAIKKARDVEQKLKDSAQQRQDEMEKTENGEK